MAIIGKKFKDSFGARGQPKTVVKEIQGKGIAKDRTKNDSNIQVGLHNGLYISLTSQVLTKPIYITHENAVKLAYWILDNCDPYAKKKMVGQSNRNEPNPQS